MLLHIIKFDEMATAKNFYRMAATIFGLDANTLFCKNKWQKITFVGPCLVFSYVCIYFNLLSINTFVNEEDNENVSNLHVKHRTNNWMHLTDIVLQKTS